jgi:histone-lysine N-methyltransferase SETDB1
MRCGWSREIGKQRNSSLNVIVFYRAPCGRRMRNMDELHQYLRITNSELGVDLFCFDNRIDCFREFQPERVYSRIDGKLVLGIKTDFFQFLNFILVFI